MRKVIERVEAAAPPSIAVSVFERYLKNTGYTLQLEVPLKDLGLPTELGLERAVIVDFTSHRHGQFLGRLNESVSLSWRPVDDGPYPTFKGSLTIRPLGTKTELELHGHYEPPLGALGAAFDAVVGGRLAHAAGKALLAELAGELEREFGAFKAAIDTAP